MSTYRLADTHNVALGSLGVLSPQPKGDPVAPVQRNSAVSGAIHDQGKFVVWRWNTLKDEAALLAVLTTHGLHNADSNDVTIYTRSERLVWTRYNATCILPQANTDFRWEFPFLRALEITFIKLTAL